MSDLPEPLTGADVDLTDFGFMPLDVRRLRDSRLAATATGDQFMAAVLLWCASWHQVPAASIPDDDVELSNLAGYGRVIKEWKKVRDGALHGWVKCSDGRLYHPVIAEKAIEAWFQKREHAWSRECDRIRKENKRRTEVGQISLPFPRKPLRNSSGTDTGNPTEADIPSFGIPSERPVNSEGIPPENALKGQGEEKERKKLASHPDSEAPREPRRRPPKPAVLTLNADGPAWFAAGGGRATVGGWDIETAARLVAEAAGINAYRQAFDWTPVIAWLDAGRELHDDILPTIRRIAARTNYQPVESLGYFTRAVMGDGVPA